MLGPPSIFVQILFLVSFVTMFVAILKWTALVRLEYDRYRVAWLDDGGPISWNWSPPQATFVGSWVATNILMVRWLFQTPSWVRNDHEAGELLRKYRIYFVVSVVLLSVVLLSVVFAGWGRI
jgi:hypothetical protein